MTMRQFNVHEAKTHLSRLVEAAEGGEEIVIARNGRPVARLVPLEATPRPRFIGSMRGEFVVPDDFDALLPDEVLTGFEGR